MGKVWLGSLTIPICNIILWTEAINRSIFQGSHCSYVFNAAKLRKLKYIKWRIICLYNWISSQVQAENVYGWRGMAELFHFIWLCYINFISKHIYILAHKELIGYSCSSVHPFIISNTFSSETACPIKAKFYMEPPWVGGTKVCWQHLGHMTKMATTPIYGKKPSKIFSGTGGPISLKPGM